jgi:hypothetical protein
MKSRTKTRTDLPPRNEGLSGNSWKPWAKSADGVNEVNPFGGRLD